MTIDATVLAATPPHLCGPLLECAAGAVPAEIAAMRLLIEAKREGEAEGALERAVRELEGPDPTSAARLVEALELIRLNAHAWATVKAVVRDTDHAAGAKATEGSLREWARVFDRAATISPEAGVALYSLGSPDILARATAEVVERTREWGLVAFGHVLLDVGCGIGRFEEILAPQVAHIIGLDISGEMIAVATERCRHLANVSLMQSDGLDLASIASGSVDLVMYVDVFPYLVHAGSGLAERHVREAARVLKPRGSLLVLNYSYRDDLAADRAEVAESAASAGLAVVLSGTKPFKHWDGAAYRLAKEP